MASKVDALINTVKSKLAAGGNIYYVGYAKFFDDTDSTCDKVSWHLWWNYFYREYLTQARRKAMNEVVDIMNDALRAAVQRGGPQVHFVDFDRYVGIVGGRFCEPGQDESKKRGANRRDLFFYQMHTVDQPWIPHDELRRRDDKPSTPESGSPLNELYGALIQATIDENPLVALEDDNASNDLQAEVDELEPRSEPLRRDSTTEQQRDISSSYGSIQVRKDGMANPSWNKTIGLQNFPTATAPASPPRNQQSHVSQ
ncbi:uncharacterized protein RCC_10912 [Ramularia collo-cygni]|uniref:Uncharacterized protein n=1 Tax=Ramularia collo-cygni TaxID=112498 RepID=A0A2D3VAT1_9PEZI|nr:uncharacterized protein RCC_10912 [Ramularia collo-cygni]CZT25183.1 uncharacterized protein RCC_10912 [Ramularia collo-cygni]